MRQISKDHVNIVEQHKLAPEVHIKGKMWNNNPQRKGYHIS
jgi:hypothetical protein